MASSSPSPSAAAFVFFDGDIAAAVKASFGKLLIVYVTDSENRPAETAAFSAIFDDASNNGIAAVVASSAVALKLDLGSHTCNLFSQVYPVFSTPCIYIIKGGVCSDIVLSTPEVPSADAVVGRIQAQAASLVALPPPTASTSTPAGAAAAAGPTPAPHGNNSANNSPAPAATAAAPSRPIPPAASSGRQTSSSSTQSGSAAITAPVAAKKIPTAAASSSSSLPKSKPPAATQPAAEVPASSSSSSRTIAPKPKKAPAPPPEPRPPVVVNYDHSSIAVRLFDGSTIRNKFKASDTLGDVRKFVDVERPKLGAFEMSLTYPVTLFSAVDESKTLKELDLVPSASITLRPVSSFRAYPSGNSSEGTNASSGVVSLVLSPFYFLFSVIGSVLQAFSAVFIGGAGAAKPAARPPAASASSASGTASRSPSASARPERRGGAIRTISDMTNGDDEDRNTYNGNSTSQGW
ncbi:hypothetical protein DFJ73DRAFT_861508 [Zopfochytrium polystomum]|nr:hypothetical protein DFJ73DRAFT_861508 [Zopfochytrium polystomum]